MTVSEARLRACLYPLCTDGLLGPEVLLTLFADCSAELSVRDRGGTGLIAKYESVELLRPLNSGDYVEVVGRVVKRGNRSRRVELVAWRSLEAPAGADKTAGWIAHDPPEMVARAVLISVTPRSGRAPTDESASPIH